jgi:hypothetical protein
MGFAQSANPRQFSDVHAEEPAQPVVLRQLRFLTIGNDLRRDPG